MKTTIRRNALLFPESGIKDRITLQSELFTTNNISSRCHMTQSISSESFKSHSKTFSRNQIISDIFESVW